MVGVAEEIVAEQDRRLRAPFGVDRPAMASGARLVQDIVVDQRGGVDHLDRRRQADMLFADAAASPSRGEQQQRPEPLATERDRAIHEPLDMRGPTLDLAGVDPLNLGQFVADRFVSVRQPSAGLFRRE